MKNNFRKKIVLIGGLGTIGRILEKGLKDAYELLILDIAEPTEINMKNYRKADMINIDQLHAVRSIIDSCRMRGYEFVSVHDLIGTEESL